MSRLPFLSTIGQAFAVLASCPGKILFWMLGPLLFSLAAVGIGGGFFWYSHKWWTAAPFGVLAVYFWMPFYIRLNQLAVLGRVEPGRYIDKIFDDQSIRCFKYVCLTAAISLAGMGMAAAPALIHGLRHGFDSTNGTLALAISVGMVLFVVFLVLFAPMHLIYPAVSVEAAPSLGRAYSLGAGNKLRLFAAMTAVQMLFAVLSRLVDAVGGAFCGSDKMPQMLWLTPLHVTMGFFSNVLNMIVPAVAYRFFRNMPDPFAPQQRARQASPAGTPASRPPGENAPGESKEQPPSFEER